MKISDLPSSEKPHCTSEPNCVVADYESLSNEDLTVLLIKKFPQKFFRVTDSNRHMAIALIQIASQRDQDLQ